MNINSRKNNNSVLLSDYWDEPISCFKHVKSTDPKQISLRLWIEACTNPQDERALRHKQVCEEFRQTGNKKLKLSIPAISPGAVVLSRCKDLANTEKIATVTGWMQFDVDLKDNPHITDAKHLRNEISKIVFVAYCSVSVSGRGVWGLIRVQSTDKYKEHFAQLKMDFASRGIYLDPSKGGNPTDLRIYSYDPQAYIAKQFRIYDRIYKQPPARIQRFKQSQQGTDVRKQVENLISEIQNKRIDIAEDYESYRNLGFALANAFGEAGRSLYHATCSVSAKYNDSDADNQFSHCLQATATGNVITIATFFFLCKEAGIELAGGRSELKYSGVTDTTSSVV